MKYILIIFLNLSVYKLLSNDLIQNSHISYSMKTFELPNGTTISSYRNKGTFTDNYGNYGRIECLGTIKKNQDNKVNLNVVCESTDQNDNKTWVQNERNSEELNVGSGISTIIAGTGPYKKLIGIKGVFAIKYKNDIGYVLTKYRLDQKQKKSLSKQ